MTNNATERKISFSEFKKATHHQKVWYVWKKTDGTTVKDFVTDCFYCNNYKGVLSMPKFCLSSEAEWYKDDVNHLYLHVSEFGTTIFKILNTDTEMM